MEHQEEQEQTNGTDLVEELMQNLDQDEPDQTDTDEQQDDTDDKEQDEQQDEAAAAKKTGTAEQHIPPAEAARLREDRRNLRTENEFLKSQQAELKGRLDALTEMVARQRSAQTDTTEEKRQLSPLEEFEKEYGSDTAPDAAVLIAERKWQEEQARQRAEMESAAVHSKTISEAVRNARILMSDERLGHGLGLDSVVGLAKQSGLITDADHTYAAQFGQKAPQVLYKIAVEKIQIAGGAPLKELSARIAAKKSANPLNPKKKATKEEVNPSGQQLNEEDDNYNSDILQYMFS